MTVRRFCAPFLSPPRKAGYDSRIRRIASKSRNITVECRFWQQADQDSYSAPTDIARLWVHECERVFRDRIISAPEMEVLDGMMAETAKKNLAELQVRRKLCLLQQRASLYSIVAHLFSSFVSRCDKKVRSTRF